MDKSNDRDSEKCPIYLDAFQTQEVGTPDVCDHTFCVSCLQKWRKNNNNNNNNNCPIDRKKFDLILVRLHLGGKIIKRISVKPPKQQIQVDPDDWQFRRCKLRSGWKGYLLCFIIFVLLLCAVVYDILSESKSHTENLPARTRTIGRPTPITVPHFKDGCLLSDAMENLGLQEGTRRTAD
jgi:hypothetical protein